MRTHPSRPLAVAAAVLAALWAFVLLPPQHAVWSGADSPPWIAAIDALPIYRELRQWLSSIGLDDFYLTFGAAASVSFILIWYATGPTFAVLGWSGRVLGWLVLLSAPITFLSYLNHPTDAPLHWLWGAEAFALLLIGLWAVVAAVAPRTSAIPVWETALLAATLPIVFMATIAFGYWPHGSLIGLGVEASVLAAWAPRPSPSIHGATTHEVDRDEAHEENEP
ncbi:MAG TPA: hypothetical protein VFG92_09015 [Agromyces sp.]|nr:hypothetical protein [Agromyces sp.]